MEERRSLLTSAHQLCWGDLSSFMQDLLSRSKSRVRFLTNGVAASALRPSIHSTLLLPVHCSPGNFGNKPGRIYEPISSLSHTQVQLWGEPLLHAAVAEVAASLGTGSARVPSSEMSCAGTSSHRCWSCQRSACCQPGLQFSGSHKLKNRVDERNVKQEIRGYNSDPNFVPSVPNTVWTTSARAG